MKGTLVKQDIWQLVLVVMTMIFVLSTLGHIVTTSQAKEVKAMMDEAGTTFGEFVFSGDMRVDNYNAMLKPYVWFPLERWLLADFVWMGGIFRLGSKGYTVEATAQLCIYRDWMILSFVMIIVAKILEKKNGEQAMQELNDDANSHAILRREDEGAKRRRRSAEYEMSWGDYGCKEFPILLLVAMVGGVLGHLGFILNQNLCLVIAMGIMILLRIKRFKRIGGRFVKIPKERRERRRRGFRLFGRRERRSRIFGGRRRRESSYDEYDDDDNWSFFRRSPKYASGGSRIRAARLWILHWLRIGDY